MANASAPFTTTPTEFEFEPLCSFSATLTENAFRIHRMQIDALLSLQKTVATAGQDFYDAWACRFAGGVPIDG